MYIKIIILITYKKQQNSTMLQKMEYTAQFIFKHIYNSVY